MGSSVYIETSVIGYLAMRPSARLVTWNCKHIANPALRGIIEVVCRASGYVAPVTCTPIELIEVI